MNTSWGWYLSRTSEEEGKRIMDHVTHANAAHAAPCPTALLVQDLIYTLFSWSSKAKLAATTSFTKLHYIYRTYIAT